MKTAAIILSVLLFSSAVQAATCRQQNTVRDRKAYTVNWAGYQQCVEATYRRNLENELLQSQIELNRAKAKWLKDDNRARYYRHFPEKG